MKAIKIITVAAITLFSVCSLPAFTVPIADYDYTSISGADPTLQGWTYQTNLTNVFLGGFDASVYTGQSGWRVVDGTSSGFANYQIDLTAEKSNLFKTGWTVEWTFKLDASAWRNNGAGAVTDYYLPPNQSRQNDNGLWIETSGENSFRYYLRATADAEGNLAIADDGPVLHVLTSGGGNNGYDREYTVSITYDGTDAILSFDGNDFTLNKLETAGNDRVLFGAHSSGGQGSVVYHAVRFIADAPAFAVSESDDTTAVAENAGSDTYGIQLLPDPNTLLPTAERWPSSPVTVTIIPDSQVNIEPTSVVFPAWTGNPDDYQATITVTGVNDTDLEGQHTGLITHSAVSSDSNWDGEAVPDVVVDITDDDGTPEFNLSEEYLTVFEHPGDPLRPSQTTYEISIPFPPEQDVTVNIGTDDQLSATSAVTFTSADWSPRTVTVNAVDDEVVEDTPHPATITHTVITTDLNYGTVSPDDLTVLVMDNEVQSPGATTPYAWFKAETGVFNVGAAAADTDLVDLWGDQSGSGHNLNIVSGTGPVFAADGGKDGQPALRFDDGALWSDSDSWGPLIDATIFVVASVEQSGNNYLFDSASFSGRKAVLTNDAGYGVFAGDTLQIEQDVYTDSPAVYTTVFSDPNTGSLYFNGLLLGTADVGGQSMNGLMLGARANSIDRLEGTISEVLVYDAALTETERKAIESYLMSKWLNDVELYESNGDTVVAETGEPVADTLYMAATGAHGALTVTSDPDAELDLGLGADTAVSVNFAASAETAVQSLTVQAVDDAESEGPEEHTIVNSSSVAVEDAEVTIEDDEPYCGKEPDQVYLPADLNRDCYVDLQDLAEISTAWLACTDPFNPADCVLELP